MSHDSELLPGIWTIGASVLCYPCHGPGSGLFTLRADAIARGSAPLASLDANQVATYCDRCGRSVAVNAKVGKEHELVRRLRTEGVNASMVQTGGMQSAAVIPLPKGEELVVTLDESNLNRFVIAHVNADGEELETPQSVDGGATAIVVCGLVNAMSRG